MERLNKNAKASLLELIERFDLESRANVAAAEGRMIEKVKQSLEKLGTVKIELQKEFEISIESEKH